MTDPMPQSPPISVEEVPAMVTLLGRFAMTAKISGTPKAADVLSRLASQLEGMVNATKDAERWRFVREHLKTWHDDPYDDETGHSYGLPRAYVGFEDDAFKFPTADPHMTVEQIVDAAIEEESRS